jgi:hypothetical protein
VVAAFFEDLGEELALPEEASVMMRAANNPNPMVCRITVRDALNRYFTEDPLPESGLFSDFVAAFESVSSDIRSQIPRPFPGLPNYGPIWISFRRSRARLYYYEQSRGRFLCEVYLWNNGLLRRRRIQLVPAKPPSLAR